MTKVKARATRGRGGYSCAVLAAAAMTACGHARETAAEKAPDGGKATVTEVAPGAAGGAALGCSPSGACSPLAKGSEIAAPSRVQTTRGARARLALGDGATADLGGDAAVLLADDGAIVVERGLVTISDAANRRVRVLDHVVSIGEARATVSVLAAAADRATITLRHGRATLAGAQGEPVDLATGDSVRAVLGAAPDAVAGLAVAPAPSPRPATGEAGGAPDERRVTPRGFGTLSARVPGTSAVATGVRLTSHKVAVTIRDGFARTEIEEEFTNTSARVLEGTYRFPVPSGASLSRLALWVGKDLVEGEIVEKERAARIFKGIVDDTVRPRDPALLEWIKGGAFSLKIFPIPAKGSRKVVLAYDEALEERGGRARYVYPLSLGKDAATAADRFSISVTASDGAALSEVMTPGYAATLETQDGRVVASYAAERFVPAGDFELAFQREGDAAAHVSTYAPKAGEFKDTTGQSYAAVRVRVDPPKDATTGPRRVDRVIALDVSHSQSPDSLADAVKLATRFVRDLDEDERFVVLACDSACASFPADGLARADATSVAGAAAFLGAQTPGGSSDIAGALLEAARRLEASTSKQVVMLGDGQATSGELAGDAIAARVKDTYAAAKIDLRLLGLGRTLDEVVLRSLASGLGAGYARVDDGHALRERGDRLAVALRRPLVTNAKLTLPDGFTDVFPAELPSLAIGDEVTVLARASAEALAKPVAIKLEGSVGGAAYATLHTTTGPAPAFQNAIVPRLWAEARIAALETSDEAADGDEVVRLSKTYHVASRRTSLLVLENDRMFAAYGVERTTTRAGDQSDHVFGLVGGAPLATSPDALGALTLPDLRADAPRSAWGDPQPREGGARGNMWGDASGTGGLGLTGVGEGGGGRGDAIGLGKIGSVGHGAGTGEGQGFGSGHGRLGGSHRSSPPRIRMGATRVNGRLPPEVVQRIVRQNFGRFRMCYEHALGRNPTLEGRVVVRFVIGRGGSVPVAGDGGSDIADAEMKTCIFNAFRALSFPSVEDAAVVNPVTVTYPLQFTSDGSRPPSPPRPAEVAKKSEPEKIWPLRPEEMPPKRTAVHRPGDETWRTQGEAVVAKARAAVDADPTSRTRREVFVRTLLGHGRFDEAATAAGDFVAADPDSVVAGELLAEALAATGDATGALRAVDAAVEGAPRSVAAHARAARAFEASGDERRACAHWRSLAELQPRSDAAQADALRCRARGGDHDGALVAAKAVERPGPRVRALTEQLTAGPAPAFEDRAPAGRVLVAKVTCAPGVERCGSIVVVTPTGSVISPWTPASWRTSSSEIGLAALSSGAYRTRLVGAPEGARATVTLDALGAHRRFEVDGRRGGATAATTQLTNMEFGS